MHLLAHWLGLDNGSGPIYLGWSGAGGDITELAVVAALLALVRRHNCHTKGCWRIGRHKVPGTEFICCAKHTPGGPPTYEDILAAHHAAMKARPGP